MIREIVNLSIDGEPQDELTPDLLALEVHEDAVQGSVFRLRLALRSLSDGTFSWLDDARFSLWKRVSVEAGYPDDVATIFDGYVTHAEATIADSVDASFFEVSGMDATALMDLEDKQVGWPNKKDSEIAAEIFGAYGLSYEIEDTVTQHAESVRTVLQAESDIRLLRRLAHRNGFECYVRAGTGYFRSPNFQDAPQKLLALQFGAETNLVRLHVTVDGTPPAQAVARRIDPLTKEETKLELTDTPRRRLGRSTLNELRDVARPGRRVVRQHAADSDTALAGQLRAGIEPAAEFVVAEGEIDTRAYRAVLRAHRLVTLKGAGALHSGLYYVSGVRHRFDPAGYVQEFRAYRNALGLTGDENFGGMSLPFAISAGAIPASAPAGNRVLPAENTQTLLKGTV
jgi:phage protein D